MALQSARLNNLVCRSRVSGADTLSIHNLKMDETVWPRESGDAARSDDDDDSPPPPDPPQPDAEIKFSEQELKILSDLAELPAERRFTLRGEAMCEKEEANDDFKAGRFEESIEKYSTALEKLAEEFDNDRSVLYSNRATAKWKMSQNTAAIQDCSKALQLKRDYLKPRIRRAQCYEALEKYEEATEDWKIVLEMEPRNDLAHSALRRYPALISERNERLKTEMMGKLKDLGNTVLKPFGLSTNNFKFDQDPNTGGYNIRFEQNK